MGKKYNGYEARNAWNVSLWLNNDEGLYNLMRHHIRRSKTRDQAAVNMLADLNDMGYIETPDGCRYTKTSIKGAMVGL